MKKIRFWSFLLFFLFVLTILYFENYKKKNDTIDLNTICKKNLNNKKEKSNNQNYALEYIIQKDTLKYNISDNYDDSFAKLSTELYRIDTIQSNKETKDYLKCLIIADFVYAAFSFQFMGPKLGYAKDAATIKNWKTLSLESCFNLGNKNEYAVFCGERTKFYNRLINKLVTLKTRETSIKGIHTFPIIKIGNKEYIIDPYDPFVAIDTLERTVLDYNSILKKQYKSLKPIRTNRTFGPSRMLISSKFYEKLKKTYGTINLGTMLNKYLTDNDSYISIFKPKNFEVPIEKTKKIRIVLNSKNIFAVAINGRIDGNLITEKDFYKFYMKSKTE